MAAVVAAAKEKEKIIMKIATLVMIEKNPYEGLMQCCMIFSSETVNTF